MLFRLCITCLALNNLILVGCGSPSSYLNERQQAENHRTPESAKDLQGNENATSGVNNLDPARQRAFILSLINSERHKKNLVLLVEDSPLNAFADEANADLAAGNEPHNYIKQQSTQSLQSKGICKRGAENQAPNWPFVNFDSSVNAIMKAMFDPTTSPSHYSNLTNNQFSRIGISFKQSEAIIDLTLIFSESCPVPSTPL